MVPNAGGIWVRDAVEAFLRYTDKPMAASPDSVIQGLSQACKDRLIGIGRGTSTEKLQTGRCGEYVALDRSEEGVWVIPAFTEQPADPMPQKVGPGTDGAVIADHEEVTSDDTSTETGKVPVGTKTNAVKSISIAGKVPLDSWTEVFRCFVGPAARLGLKSLELGIAFKLVAQDGQPLDPDDPTLRAMREAARQLGIQIVEDGVS